jgi:hypothetical protein
MSLIKKIDVKAHFAARRAMRLRAAASASQPDATGFSGVAPDVQKGNAACFVEDFARERSSEGVSVAPVAIAGESGKKQAPTLRESRQT